MAKTPSAVTDLLTSLHDLIIRHLPSDLSKLLHLKKHDPAAQDQPNANVILWSDIPYYTRLYEEQNYSVDQDRIAEYFPLYETVSKMLALFGKLLGFEFIELTKRGTNSAAEQVGQGLIWHTDVRLYSVWNDSQEGGEFAGYLYLDLHPRPGKAGGAQCCPLQLGFSHADGHRHHPSTVLLTNFPNPSPGKPSLLHHSSLTLLFHELGHCIHDLSGQSTYSRFHGAETSIDFSEAPSQMLENWCWDAVALRELSGHYETGGRLPDEVIEALVWMKGVLAAVKIMPQMRMTVFDGVVHSALESGEEIDVGKIYRECDELGGITSIGDE